MAGDKDVIDDEHTLEIFHHLPNAHLCIFPGATHMIPWEDPQLFNAWWINSRAAVQLFGYKKVVRNVIVMHGPKGVGRR